MKGGPKTGRRQGDFKENSMCVHFHIKIPEMKRGRFREHEQKDTIMFIIQMDGCKFSLKNAIT